MAPPVPYLTRPSVQPPTGEPKNQAPFTRSVLPPKTSGGEPKNQLPFTRSTKVTPTPRGTATGPHPGTGTTTGKTQAQLDQEQIDAWVRAAQLPQIQAIQAAQKAADDQAKANAASIQGYYQALAGLMANIGPATQQGYQQAAGADSAFGKGFSDGLAHIQSQMGSEATNALGISGAPASQQTEATQAIGGTGATDALYGAYGYIPATTMTREGAAFGAAANLLPASSAYEGAQQIKQLMDATTTKDDAFRQQLTDLAAQVPGLTLQYGQQLQSQHAAAARDAFNQAMSIKKYNEQVIHDAATEHDRANALAYTKYLGSQRTAKDLRDYNRSVVTSDRTYTLEVQKANNATAVANARLGIAEQNATTARMRAKGAGTATGTGGQKLPTAAQINKVINGWYQGKRVSQRVQAVDANGKPVTKTDAQGNVTPVYTTTYKTVNQTDYSSAYKQLVNSYGYTDAQARKMLSSVYPRGANGRAWLTNEEQLALEKVKANPQANVTTHTTKNGTQVEIAWLNANQMKALRRAHRVPPTQYVAHQPGVNGGKPLWVIKSVN